MRADPLPPGTVCTLLEAVVKQPADAPRTRVTLPAGLTVTVLGRTGDFAGVPVRLVRDEFGREWRGILDAVLEVKPVGSPGPAPAEAWFG